MSKSNAKIRDESTAYYDMSTEEREVLRIKDALDKKLVLAKHTDSGFKGICTEATKMGFDVATRHGVLVIDKVRMLDFPLADPRTSKILRNAYLKQEELMILDAQVTREEENEIYLSSPAKEVSQSTEYSTHLKDLVDEQVKIFTKQDWSYMKQIFPEKVDTTFEQGPNHADLVRIAEKRWRGDFT